MPNIYRVPLFGVGTSVCVVADIHSFLDVILIATQQWTQLQNEKDLEQLEKGYLHKKFGGEVEVYVRNNLGLNRPVVLHNTN
ncbi:hypothetical protein Trydic_g3402 [Trypoxylus dichotomus]